MGGPLLFLFKANKAITEMVYRPLKHKKKTGSAIYAPPVRVLVILQLY